MTIENLSFFKAEYSNYPSPPPFLYHYTISLQFEKEKNHVQFELKYLDRDELDEEEIYEEGFSLNDDYQWEGFLPDVWIQEIKELLQKTNTSKGENNSNIHLELEADGKQDSFTPSNYEKWDYLLQELVQAIYEISQKENPLEIQYKEIQAGKNDIDISLTASFALRKAELRKSFDPKDKVKELSWPKLKNLLSIIYLPDYDYEAATDKSPTKPGKYLATGEGLWFKFGKAIINPGKTNDVLKKIEDILKNS